MSKLTSTRRMVAGAVAALALFTAGESRADDDSRTKGLAEKAKAMTHIQAICNAIPLVSGPDNVLNPLLMLFTQNMTNDPMMSAQRDIADKRVEIYAPVLKLCDKAPDIDDSKVIAFDEKLKAALELAKAKMGIYANQRIKEPTKQIQERLNAEIRSLRAKPSE